MISAKSVSSATLIADTTVLLPGNMSVSLDWGLTSQNCDGCPTFLATYPADNWETQFLMFALGIGNAQFCSFPFYPRAELQIDIGEFLWLHFLNLSARNI